MLTQAPQVTLRATSSAARIVALYAFRGFYSVGLCILLYLALRFQSNDIEPCFGRLTEPARLTYDALVKGSESLQLEGWGSSQQSRWQMVLLLPGITRPIFEFVPLLLAMCFSLTFHELGHYVASLASGVPITGSVVSKAPFGAALKFDTPAFESLSAPSRAAIISAGIWHNVFLCASISHISYAFDAKHYVLEQSPGTTIVWTTHAMESIGLHSGYTITQVNGMAVNNASELLGWLRDPSATVWHTKAICSKNLAPLSWDEPSLVMLNLEYHAAAQAFQGSTLSDFRFASPLQALVPTMVLPLAFSLILLARRFFSTLHVYLFITSSSLAMVNALPLPLPGGLFGGATDGLRLVRSAFFTVCKAVQFDAVSFKKDRKRLMCSPSCPVGPN